MTVVRELYDAEKGIYDVLEEFINEIITRNRWFSFSASDLTARLNDEYSFQLNDSVVRTCLKRMHFEKSNGKYKCDDLEKRSSDINNFLEKSKAENKELFLQLYHFLEERLHKQFSEQEKRIIRNSFCDFLLQESLGNSDAYTQYFHEFVLAIEDDHNKMEVLQNIKEGTLIYEGICYCSNVNETGAWQSKLQMVLDTEILFAIGGYNSSMYQDMWSELDKYLKEINRGCPAGIPKIKLTYFSETKQEIDAYFESAERIVKGLDSLDPTKEAMGQIVNNCSTPSDVQTKKALFFQKLREHNITVVDRDFYDKEIPDNFIYNLEKTDIDKKYAEQWKEKEENIYRSMRSLSHINILRKGVSNKGFENCSCIFLTATGRTLKLAFVPEFWEEGNVPLATTYDFLINRFWFKLNKGFGRNKTPRTIDMVMRAKHILSTIITSKASEKYDEYKDKYEKSEISKEDFWALNESLRQKLKTPEEVDKDTIGAEIDSLDRWNFDSVIEEQKKKEQELLEARGEITSLKKQIESSEKSRQDLKKQLMDIQSDFEVVQSRQNEEQSALRSALKIEQEKNKNNTLAINSLREALNAESKKQEENSRKAERTKYHVLLAIVVCALIIGAVLFVIGVLYELAWAKIVSALIEFTTIVSFVLTKVKKANPDDKKKVE